MSVTEVVWTAINGDNSLLSPQRAAHVADFIMANPAMSLLRAIPTRLAVERTSRPRRPTSTFRADGRRWPSADVSFSGAAQRLVTTRCSRNAEYIRPAVLSPPMVAILGYEKHAMQHLFLTISTASRSRWVDSGPNEILPLLTFRAARLFDLASSISIK